MNRFCFRLIPVLALAILAAPLFGQQGRPRGGFGDVGAAQLLANKAVAEELKLSDEQKEKLQSSLKDVMGKFREEMQTAFKDKDQDKLAKIRKEMGEEVSKLVDKSLKPEQVKRLQQIEIQANIQMRGPAGLTSEKVAKEIKLTDKQKDAIKEATEGLTKEREELFKGLGRDDREKMQEARTKLQGKTKEALEKISATLSEDQKKALKELTGAPFEYKPEPFRRPQQ